MKQKTALNQFIERLKNDWNIVLSNNVVEKYLEVEKQQILKSYQQGQLDLIEDILLVIPEDMKDDFEDAEQYFTKTFTNE